MAVAESGDPVAEALLVEGEGLLRLPGPHRDACPVAAHRGNDEGLVEEAPGLGDAVIQHLGGPARLSGLLIGEREPGPAGEHRRVPRSEQGFLRARLCRYNSTARSGSCEAA